MKEEIQQIVEQVIDGGELSIIMQWRRDENGAMSDFNAVFHSSVVAEPVQFNKGEDLFLEDWIDVIVELNDDDRQFHSFGVRALKNAVEMMNSFIEQVEADGRALGFHVEFAFESGEETYSGKCMVLTYSISSRGEDDVPELVEVFSVQVPLSI